MSLNAQNRAGTRHFEVKVEFVGVEKLAGKLNDFASLKNISLEDTLVDCSGI